MANAQSFIQAGGIARWEFLVFKHNEHQVEQARQLAKDMGFKAFFVKRTARFFDYKTGVNIAFPVLDKDGNQVGSLEPPTDESLINPVSLFTEQKTGPKRSTEATTRSASLRSLFGSLDQYFKKASVDCMSQIEKSIYITARGEVFPCCFLAGQVRYTDPGDDGEKLDQMILKTHGGESGISAIENSLSTITDSG